MVFAAGLYTYIQGEAGPERSWRSGPAVQAKYLLRHSPTKTMLPERVLVWIFSPRLTVKVW